MRLRLGGQRELLVVFLIFDDEICFASKKLDDGGYCCSLCGKKVFVRCLIDFRMMWLPSYDVMVLLDQSIKWWGGWVGFGLVGVS